MWYVQNCIAMSICCSTWSLNEYTYFIFTASICSYQLELESLHLCFLYCHRSRLPPSLNVCYVWSRQSSPFPHLNHNTNTLVQQITEVINFEYLSWIPIIYHMWGGIPSPLPIHVTFICWLWNTFICWLLITFSHTSCFMITPTPYNFK